MKQESDVQLIDDILSGDDAAFNALVNKYQKSVHALVWRKIGDFHYGITSEAKNLRIFGLSVDGNTLVPTQKIPAFDEKTLSTESWTTIAGKETHICNIFSEKYV